jgi:hypothetical protein
MVAGWFGGAASLPVGAEADVARQHSPTPAGLRRCVLLAIIRPTGSAGCCREQNVTPEINSKNVGRIAERIVASELEARGFRVSDLNSDGIAANADLIISGRGVTRQIQVKGATNGDRAWVQYGFCNDEIIKNSKSKMFNRRKSFYKADFVVLVGIRSVTDYRCVILPIREAEKAAQANLDREYRTPTLSGQERKPHKVWAWLDPAPLEHKRTPDTLKLVRKERAILSKYEGDWGVLTRK